MEIYPSVEHGGELYKYYKFIASEEVCSFDDAIHVIMRTFPVSLFRDCAKDYSRLNPFVPSRNELFGYSNKDVEKIKRKLQLALEEGLVEVVEYKRSFAPPNLETSATI